MWVPANNQYDGVNSTPTNDVEVDAPFYVWEFSYNLLAPIQLFAPLLTTEPGQVDPDDPDAPITGGSTHKMRVMVVPPEKGQYNPVLGRWKKQPTEELRYEIDWSRWLIPGEYLTSAFVELPPEFNNDEKYVGETLELSDPYFMTSAQVVVYFVRAGKSGAEYQVTHRVTTTLGQLAEREVYYEVEEV